MEATETLLQKKLERNGFSRVDETDNFAETKELTVTITLAEYRELVSKNAISKHMIDEVTKDKWERTNQINKLTEQVNFLKGQLVDYKLKYGELGEEDAGTDRK